MLTIYLYYSFSKFAFNVYKNSFPIQLICLHMNESCKFHWGGILFIFLFIYFYYYYHYYIKYYAFNRGMFINQFSIYVSVQIHYLINDFLFICYSFDLFQNGTYETQPKNVNTFARSFNDKDVSLLIIQFPYLHVSNLIIESQYQELQCRQSKEICA